MDLNFVSFVMHRGRWDKLIMLIIQVYLPLKKIVPYEYWRLSNNSSGSDYPNCSLWRNILPKNKSKYLIEDDLLDFSQMIRPLERVRRDESATGAGGNAVVGGKKRQYLQISPNLNQNRHDSWNNTNNNNAAFPHLLQKSALFTVPRADLL